MRIIATIAAVCALALPAAATAKPPPIKKSSCETVRTWATFYQQETWRWQKRSGQPRTRASASHSRSCAYARWVRDLWWQRKVDARRAHFTIPTTRTWTIAVRLTQRVYPGTASWLLYISHREGGWGQFVMNHQGSGAGGWMQFMSSTFYGYVDDARTETTRRGFHVNDSIWRWTHPLGQALTAGYMRYTGRDGCHWCL